jgi:hypothetical protein
VFIAAQKEIQPEKADPGILPFKWINPLIITLSHLNPLGGMPPPFLLAFRMFLDISRKSPGGDEPFPLENYQRQ